MRFLAVLLFCNEMVILFNPISIRKAKIVHNFGLSECNRINVNE